MDWPQTSSPSGSRARAVRSWAEQLEPRKLLSGTIPAPAPPALVVNTAADETDPNDNVLSLREAIAAAQSSGQPITFDPSLVGATINLSVVNGPLQVTSAVTINGPGSGQLTITASAESPLHAAGGSLLNLSNVSMGGANPVLRIDLGGQAFLQDVTESAPVTDNGVLNVVQSQAGIWSGPISGAGALIKSGIGSLALTTVNSYSGGTTVAAGTLLVYPTAGNPLGFGPLSLAGGTVSLLGQTTTPAQEVIPLSGFNQDVIVDAAASDPVSSTTAPFDSGLNMVWYEQGFGGAAAAGTGLPPGGSTFTSQSNPAVSFQMRPYDANNVALLTGVNSPLTLQLSQPGSFGTLNLLASGAFGGGTVNVTLGFLDGTTTTFPVTVPDWVSTHAAAYVAGGRVERTVGATVHTSSSISLYEFDYSLQPSDQARVLSSVTLNETSGSIVGVFALSGTSLSLLRTQSYPNPVFVTASSTVDVRNASTTLLGGLTISNNSNLSLTGDPGSAARFGQVIISGGDATFNVQSATTLILGSITGGANGLIKGGSGILLLAGNNSYGSTQVGSGTLQIVGAGGLPPGSALTVAPAARVIAGAGSTPFLISLSSLQLGGTLDLANNSLHIGYSSAATDPVATIRSYLVSGKLFSRLSDTDHTLGYADAADGLVQRLTPNSILIEYAVIGDINLDGVVTLADLLALTRNMGHIGAWDSGDVNYDGTVNLADFLALTRHFGQSLATAAISQPGVSAPPASARSAAKRPRR